MNARLSVAVLLLALFAIPRIAAGADAQLPLWRSLDWFRGAWIGKAEGMLGSGSTLRCTDDLFGGRFMVSRTRTDVTLHDGLREKQHFDYWQMLARDPDSGRVTLEQYESAGYRRRFVLDEDLSRSDALVFQAAHLGDAAPDRAGRLTLRILRGERYEEQLEFGESSSSLRVVRSSRWRRLDAAPAACRPGELRIPEP